MTRDSAHLGGVLTPPKETHPTMSMITRLVTGAACVALVLTLAACGSAPTTATFPTDPPAPTVALTPFVVPPTPEPTEAPTAPVEPAATVLPKAIAEMAAPDVTAAPDEAPQEAATEAPAPAAPEVQATPAASSGDSAPCAAGQFKGNRKSHIFHAPGQRDYAKTHASVECFDTAAQAKAAGYRAAKR